MAAKQIADKLISEHLIAVFSKSYCPYCSRAKSVISSLGLDSSKVGIIELDQTKEGADIQAYLADETKQRTVPNIFINEKHLGGCDDLLRAQSEGRLEQLISSA
ncbi:uncharacterized protein PFL1_02883 [Pseudozyma flocculosa PF-1]|uniref:glutathione peroxidase n=2 Tax=Pseudozyma flocculosa TaxID=84751 RepID=A0A5C3F4S7_9BASI|nr:uncharacterized protein PFL1_02883 [Pseudozyma flocculosa PF-1]EPQ29663.1 hypothetical protein PFL1_02883 [Pseudozyma flocculosa PF-1]SPO38231.1 probable GRX1 - glutaredoxin [Pseudozyma flocculosa]